MVIGMIDAQFNFKWSLNGLNAFNILDRWPDTSMAAENSLLLVRDDSCQRHRLKSFVDLGKNTIGIVGIFSKSLGALISKPKIFVHIFVFVISSEQHDLLWIFQLESEKEADDFQTVLALVDVVSKEKIIIGMDVSIFGWGLPDVEESHQVNILSVQVTNDLRWWSDIFDDDWLSCKDLSTFIRQLNDMLPLAREFGTWFYLLTLLWLQKRLEEHRAEGVIWVFVDFCVILLLGV